MFYLSPPDPTKIRFATPQEQEKLNKMSIAIEQANITRLFHHLVIQGQTPKVILIQDQNDSDKIIAQLEIGNVYYTFDVKGKWYEVDKNTHSFELFYSGWAIPNTVLNYENIQTENKSS